ncbi:hypothetical protein ACFOUV_06405 [Oceanobacillus longus]|uniref:DUF1440 domain-containing protein n=1 Tax=Oceanobacillus longus TaxID=930120 RepID=A0ABV8GWY6_9BACI
MKRLLKLIIIGVISGFILGGFLNLVEQLTGKKVYVLLMNIDYFPIIGTQEISATVEFGLHVIISILLVNVIYFLFRKWNITTRLTPYILVNGLVGGMLYSTTALSERTPAINDLSAFIYWFGGHIIYGIVVWFLVIILIDKRKDRNVNQQKI